MNCPFPFDQLEFFGYELHDMQVTRPMQTVSMLTEIKCDFSMRSLSVDNVLRFLLNFKLLNTFVVYVEFFDENLQDEWQTSLENEWKNCMKKRDLLLLKRCRPITMEIENHL